MVSKYCKKGITQVACIESRLTSHLHVFPPHLLADAVGASSEALCRDGEVICTGSESGSEVKRSAVVIACGSGSSRTYRSCPGGC
jgi:hypothetical protein